MPRSPSTRNCRPRHFAAAQVVTIKPMLPASMKHTPDKSSTIVAVPPDSATLINRRRNSAAVDKSSSPAK
jgi:hypothetical protein